MLRPAIQKGIHYDVCIFHIFLDYTQLSTCADETIFNFHFTFICNRKPNFNAFNFHSKFYFRLRKQLQRTIKRVYQLSFVSELCSLLFFGNVFAIRFHWETIEKSKKRWRFSLNVWIFNVIKVFCCVLCGCMDLSVCVLCISLAYIRRK